MSFCMSKNGQEAEKGRRTQTEQVKKTTKRERGFADEYERLRKTLVCVRNTARRHNQGGRRRSDRNFRATPRTVLEMFIAILARD